MPGTFNLYAGQILTPVPGSKFITLTLRPKLYKFPVVEQLTRSTKMFKDIVSQLYNCEGSLVAELTEQANVHFHLWIKCQYDFDYLRLVDAWKKIGFSKITTTPIINNAQILRVEKYLLKQQEIRDELFHNAVSQFHFVQIRERLPIARPDTSGIDDEAYNVKDDNYDTLYYEVINEFVKTKEEFLEK